MKEILFFLEFLYSNAIFHTFIFQTKTNCFGLVQTKKLDRPSDVTYELLPQDGSTFYTFINHLIPFDPKEPLLYPHLRNFMRFSDSIHCDISKPIIHANKDSSPFNLDDTLSDDTSSQEDLSLSPSIPPSNSIFQDNSSYNDTGFQSITKTHQPNPSSRTRHHSQNDIPIHHKTTNRQTKTNYNPRHQPRKDYRFFIPQFKFFDSQSVAQNSLKYTNFKFWTETLILDSSSESPPSVPSLPSSTSGSQTPIISQPRKINTLTPSEPPKSHIVKTSSTTSSSTLFPHTTSKTNRPPISEAPITSRSQPLQLPVSVFDIPYYMPEPENVARFVNYRQPTAIKNIRQQPQLDMNIYLILNFLLYIQYIYRLKLNILHYLKSILL